MCDLVYKYKGLTGNCTTVMTVRYNNKNFIKNLKPRKIYNCCININSFQFGISYIYTSINYIFRVILH